MQNKNSFFTVAGLFLALCLTSCGGQGGYDDDVEPFDPNKTYTIEFLGWGSIGEQQNFKSFFANFRKQYPNINIRYNVITNTEDYSTNLMNRASMNDLPDVFYVPDWDYIKYADSGKLLNLAPHLTSAEQSKMWQKSIDIFRWDKATKTVGQGSAIYGLPKDLGPTAIVYNKDLLSQIIEDRSLDVGLPSSTDPMTFTEFKEYISLFKDYIVDKQTGTKLIPLTHYDLMSAVYSNNANFYTDDSAKTQAINDKNFIDAVQFVADLSTSHLAKDATEAATSSALTSFTSQQCAFTFMGPWDMVTYWDLDLPFEYDIMPVPVGDAEGSKSTTTIGTVAYSIAGNSKNKAAALLLAKYLACSDECSRDNYKYGQAMPNVQSIAENEWVNNVDLTGKKIYPQTKSVFVNPIKGTDKVEGKSRAYYFTYSKTVYDDLMDQFLSVWSGQKTAKEVCESYANKYQEALNKMHREGV